jgi:hypothetical protein
MRVGNFVLYCLSAGCGLGLYRKEKKKGKAGKWVFKNGRKGNGPKHK